MLYFGNAASVPLQNLAVTVVPNSAVAAQVQGEVKVRGTSKYKNFFLFLLLFLLCTENMVS